MSDSVVAPLPDPTLRSRDRRRARLAVACARLLARLSPGHLEAILTRFSTNTDPAETRVALRARTAVTSVSTRCAGRWCLERSIATALVCRFDGVWPEWHTGVCTQPFRAHAWVSVDGQPIGEPDGLAETFQPVLSISAPGRSL